MDDIWSFLEHLAAAMTVGKGAWQLIQFIAKKFPKNLKSPHKRTRRLK